MFDLSIPKLLVLAVIALVIFGPAGLAKIASRAGQALRDLRQIAEGAKNDLREGLGPEFADFDIEDLNPRRFVHEHLFGGLNGNPDPGARAATQAQASRQARADGTPVAPGGRPPTIPTRPEPLPRREAEMASGQAAG